MDRFFNRRGRHGFRSSIETKTGCVYIHVRYGKVDYTSEVAKNVFVDFDKKGRAVGVKVIL